VYLGAMFMVPKSPYWTVVLLAGLYTVTAVAWGIYHARMSD